MPNPIQQRPKANLGQHPQHFGGSGDAGFEHGLGEGRKLDNILEEGFENLVAGVGHDLENGGEKFVDLVGGQAPGRPTCIKADAHGALEEPGDGNVGLIGGQSS